jgi:hypothetical protein
MVEQEQIACSTTGLLGMPVTCTFRHVLITELSALRTLRFKPGELRENVVLNLDTLYELASGTVLSIGEVRVRLTFHCEPCKVIADPSRLRSLIHRRGVLAQFLDDGKIFVGDKVKILSDQFPPIPYKSKERVVWYLSECAGPISALELVRTIGLPDSYVRALPRHLETIPKNLASKVYFKKRRPNDLNNLL